MSLKHFNNVGVIVNLCSPCCFGHECFIDIALHYEPHNFLVPFQGGCREGIAAIDVSSVFDQCPCSWCVPIVYGGDERQSVVITPISRLGFCSEFTSATRYADLFRCSSSFVGNTH